MIISTKAKAGVVEISNKVPGSRFRIKSRVSLTLPFLTLLLLCPAGVRAKSVSPGQAKRAVKGWLELDPNPLGMPLGNEVGRADTFSDTDGHPSYCVVYLKPSGFVIVPGDDGVEPIVAFVAGGAYDPSDDNPLGALVKRDLTGRLAAVRSLEAQSAGPTLGKGPSKQRAILEKACKQARSKWASLQYYGDTVAADDVLSVSDIRVPPLVQSRWGQRTVCDNLCYNYYTPNNYPCGCVATAMAQVMRYHQHPATPIGVQGFEIWVNDDKQTAYTRGGDGSGSKYLWSQMDLTPDCGTSSSQRQAIGSLCFDAGICAHMSYYSTGSGANLSNAKDALVTAFHYTNAIYGHSESGIGGSALEGMLNPNLDAGYPVILGIRSPTVVGHAIVSDGYGYNSSTLYHHLNMGWDGSDDAWYNLPDVIHWNAVVSSIYNIYTSGSGEIISGRVVNPEGDPVTGVVVTAETGGGQTYTDTTDSRGIYALEKVPSNTTFTVVANKAGLYFSGKTVGTGSSANGADYSGNIWAIDFIGRTPDFNHDGVVDANDLYILCCDWLESEYYVLKGTEPDANGLALYYSFDGTLGGDVPSGLMDDTQTYTATIITGSDPDSTIKYADPNPICNTEGTSAQFNNDNWSNNTGDTFLIPNSGGLDFSSFSEFTVELFVNPSSAGSGHDRRIFSEYIYAYMYLDSGNTLHAIRKWGGGAWNENWTHLTRANFPHDEWSHVAMTWDSDTAGDKFRLYVDGQEVGGAAGTSTPTIDSTAGFAIGGYQRESASTAQFFHGKIDEFGLYNYSLSEDEVIYIANDGPVQVLVRLDSPANLYEDGIIDSKDFAIFASEWLESSP